MGIAESRQVPRTLSGAILLNQSAGVVCQFVQHTDPRFPLLYFTIDSAVFAGAVAGLALARPLHPALSRLRGASAVGVLLSAVIFAAVIAPATSTGTWIQPYDDYWVRTATILLHGVAPVLVTIDFAISWDRTTRAGSIVTSSYVWPLLYVATVAALAAAGVVKIPYPFLSPSASGWWAVIGALCALAAMVLIIALALLGLRNGALWLTRRRARG